MLNLLSSSSSRERRSKRAWEMLDLRGVCNSMPMTSHEFTIKLMAFSHQSQWSSSSSREWRKFQEFRMKVFIDFSRRKFSNHFEWEIDFGLRHDTHSTYKHWSWKRERWGVGGSMKKGLMAQNLKFITSFIIFPRIRSRHVCCSLETERISETMNELRAKESTFGFSLCKFAHTRWAVAVYSSKIEIFLRFHQTLRLHHVRFSICFFFRRGWTLSNLSVEWLEKLSLQTHTLELPLIYHG